MKAHLRGIRNSANFEEVLPGLFGISGDFPRVPLNPFYGFLSFLVRVGLLRSSRLEGGFRESDALSIYNGVRSERFGRHGGDTE
jgi:hypothetical protein